MTSRVRAAAFAVGALACAGMSAAVAGSTEAPEAAGYGELRGIVVTADGIERGTVIKRRDLGRLLEERRVPESFAPPDALVLPAEALGRKIAVTLPAGSYVTVSDFASAGERRSREPGAPSGTTPVEIEVIGAGALAVTNASAGTEVDVVVSGDTLPGPAGGRTYVAAKGVALLGLREARAEPGLEAERWIATLAVTREEALALIKAESASAQIRLLAG